MIRKSVKRFSAEIMPQTESQRGDLAGKCALFAGFPGLNELFAPLPKDHPVTTRLKISARSALLAAAAWLVLAPLPAAAQGRLEAQYEDSLAGIPIGRGTWAIEIGDDPFHVCIG